MVAVRTRAGRHSWEAPLLHAHRSKMVTPPPGGDGVRPRDVPCPRAGERGVGMPARRRAQQLVRSWLINDVS